MLLPKIALVMFLFSSLGTIAKAGACNAEEVNTFKDQCVSASEADNEVTESVVCSAAAEQAGICASEQTGNYHYNDVMLKILLYRSAISGELKLPRQMIELSKLSAWNNAVISGSNELLGPGVPKKYQDDMARIHKSALDQRSAFATGNF